MPDVDVVGDVGASFEVDATFAVADTDHLADFTKTLLTAETFDWVISGDNLSGACLHLSLLAGCVLTGMAYSVGDWDRGSGDLAQRQEGHAEGHERPQGRRYDQLVRPPEQ